jgi:hypothetical protein
MFMHRQSNSDTKSEPKIKPAALKLAEACDYLGGIAPITLRRLIKRGLITPNRALRHILIPVAELDRFLGHPTKESCQ